VLWDALDAKVDATGGDTVALESETRAAYLHDRDPQISDGATHGPTHGPIWIRVLRTGVRPIGAIGLRAGEVTSITANALASLIAIALERARAFERESQAEAERKSEQLRTVVLDALAHEYKTPLTSLGTASSGLIAMGKLNPIQLELVSLIDSEVRRLDGLTTRLLQMSRLDRADIRLRPERIDPDELLQTVIGGMQGVLAGHPVRVEGLDSGALIKADRELLSIALTQFLDNAAKYSEPAGLITISISPAPAEVRISVHNVGPFIPPEDRERIFQRFYRSPASTHKAAGTGIGLSISRKVADAHQGRVWVTSDEARGNTFSLALPKYRLDRA
jgi:two-component system sensor histidine kinase KdpD